MHHIRRCLLAAALVLSAFCAALPAAAEETDADLARRWKAMAERVYTGPNAEPGNVEHAVQLVFRMADTGFDVVASGGDVAARRSGMLLGLSEDARGTWLVRVTPVEDGSRVTARYVPEDTDVAFAEQEPFGDADLEPAPEEMARELKDNAAISTIFFKRLDRLMGRCIVWLDCAAAEKYQILEDLSGSLDALCFQADDSEPRIRTVIQ